MSFEHVGEAETLSADVTGVWFLASVSAAVPFHIGPAREALSTDLTDIWFLSWKIQRDERTCSGSKLTYTSILADDDDKHIKGMTVVSVVKSKDFYTKLILEC